MKSKYNKFLIYNLILLICESLNPSLRLIVQLVERTAHNGLVVGSNPTEPKNNNGINN